MSNIINSNSTLDDIIFKDKNQKYGAFVLRNEYPKVITRALLAGVVAVSLFFALSFFYNKYLESKPKERKDVEAKAMDIKAPPPNKVPPPPPPPPPPPKDIPKVKMTKYLPPEIKPDEDVKKSDPPPDNSKILNNVGNQDVKDGLDDKPVEDLTREPEKELEIKKVEVKEDEIFTAVEQQAEFPGGLGALGKYLQKNLKYPAAAQRANVSGKVYVQFVVNTDGSIQNVDVIKSVGFGCDEEAVRVIKSVPRWTPGKQSGRPVRSRFTIPINFQLSE